MLLGTAVFLAGLFSMVYVLALYPMGLALYARRCRLPVQKGTQTPALTVMLPVRNGEKWMAAKLQSLLASDYPPEKIRIIVISDGSTDSTESIVSSWPDSRVQLLKIAAAGKATAINRGLEHAWGEILVFTDVRQRFEASALRSLIAPFGDPQVGVVTGELIITEGASNAEVNTGLYWKYEKWIRRNLDAIDAMLGATGAIYAVRRELVHGIPADTLLDDVHIPFDAATARYRIVFENSAKAYDQPTGLQSEFKRKVRTQAGIYQIIYRFPGLLWPGNRRFIHFASHKIGRLLLPFFLLAMLLSTPFLPPLLRVVAAAAQLCFYGAALLDPVIPERSPLKRITAIVRTFLTLVAAAFCALSIFVKPPQALWKESRSIPMRAPAAQTKEN